MEEIVNYMPDIIDEKFILEKYKSDKNNEICLRVLSKVSKKVNEKEMNEINSNLHK
jgi:hypothetical protein